MSNTQDLSSETSPRLVGQVKWFNNKSGYGFITVTEGEQSNKDIFIHYSAIRVANSQYKYLVQGEYVEFNLEKTTSEKHEYQATNITGIKGGKLMCETRVSNRPVVEGEAKPFRKYRIQPDQPVATSGEDGFTTVQRRRPMDGRGGRGGRGRGGRGTRPDTQQA
jgi:cold shock CspA family protein